MHRISENKPVQHFDDDLICFKNVLKALSEIFNVQTEIFQRDFSVKVVGDSNVFEKVKSKVISKAAKNVDINRLCYRGRKFRNDN